MDFGIAQELLRVAEFLYAPTSRREQAADRFQYGRVIVEQADNIGDRVNQSKPRLRFAFVKSILDLSLMSP